MTETDLPQIGSAFLNTLTVLNRRIRTLFDARVTACGLTYPRARVLLKLALRQPLSQKTLACELDLEQPTIVRLLDRMVELDLVSRQPDPNDKRANLIHLTRHGRDQADTVIEISDRLKREIFGEIPLDQMEEMIARMSLISTSALRALEERGQGQ